jgi:hypothetical protein
VRQVAHVPSQATFEDAEVDLESSSTAPSVSTLGWSTTLGRQEGPEEEPEEVPDVASIGGGTGGGPGRGTASTAADAEASQLGDGRSSCNNI